MVDAWEFPESLWESIDEDVYLPEQLFNVDEPGLYWKRMPDWSYISEEEKLMTDYKVAKDKLTLLFGGSPQQYETEASLSLSLREPQNIEKGSLHIM